MYVHIQSCDQPLCIVCYQKDTTSCGKGGEIHGGKLFPLFLVYIYIYIYLFASIRVDKPGWKQLAKIMGWNHGRGSLQIHFHTGKFSSEHWVKHATKTRSPTCCWTSSTQPDFKIGGVYQAMAAGEMAAFGMSHSDLGAVYWCILDILLICWAVWHRLR